ncbi:hypothetical protein HMN09_00947100 [Mycena chlorophos]|uniref:Uncharacterized protein n=1 Tax=Mycena chlorophos TaxID=658473 RepID=A0A8H6SJQ8_MYCCL|nr:hypothetical protein HMN09_00947100 [Mycena chlorophos]
MQKDAPPPRRGFVPEAGAFALMTLDPIASLEYLNDPEAIEAGQKLECKDYAVYVTGARQLLNPAAKYREERIHFILPSLPADDRSQHLDASMSMPIFPATHHPTGRAPLRPSGSFEWPWPSYVSAFIKTIVRCANVVTVDPKQCGLDFDGQLQFVRYRDEDEDIQQERQEMLQPLPQPPASEVPAAEFVPPSPEPAATSPSTGAALLEQPPSPLVLDAIANETGHGSSEQNDPEEEAVVADLLALLLQHEAGEEVPAVSFTHDLSRIQEIRDPRGFFEEVHKLAEIAQQSKLRAAAQKITAAENDAAIYDEKTGIDKMASTPTGRYIPTFGTFAALRIDPVACVAHLEDPAATAACSRITCKDYLIYAAGISKLFHPDAVFCEIDIIFIQRGQPRDIPERFIDASMTIPIAPQSAGKEHPSGRLPLKMAAGSAAFPWSDCYLSPFANHVVRTANVRVNETPVCLLDDDELMRLDGADMDDVGRQRALRFEHNQAQASASKAPTAVEAVSHTPEDERQEAESSGHAAEPTTEEREEADKALLYSLIQPEASEELTAVTFTYDLTRSGEFNDPKGFFEEVQEISRIITESLARKEAAKAEVAKEDAARYDSKTAKLLHRRRLTRFLGRVDALIRHMLCLSRRT